jgi:hypothetical protein
MSLASSGTRPSDAHRAENPGDPDHTPATPSIVMSHITISTTACPMICADPCVVHSMVSPVHHGPDVP